MGTAGADNPDVGDTINWWEFANLGAHQYSSPFRQAVCEGLGTNNNANHNNYPAAMTFRDDTAWWSDGMSNQLCMGEKNFTKALPPGFYNDTNASDCSYFTAKNGGQSVVGVVRTFDQASGYIASAWQADGLADGGTCNFAAWHVGVCNFLFGDGSMHGISKTTSIAILRQLACTCDNNVVSIP
jgi:hypothetical protein